MNVHYLKYELPRRRKLQAMGLTVFGKVRQRFAVPAFIDGLNGKERHAAYMRFWRRRTA